MRSETARGPEWEKKLKSCEPEYMILFEGQIERWDTPWLICEYKGHWMSQGANIGPYDMREVGSTGWFCLHFTGRTCHIKLGEVLFASKPFDRKHRSPWADSYRRYLWSTKSRIEEFQADEQLVKSVVATMQSAKTIKRADNEQRRYVKWHKQKFPEELADFKLYFLGPQCEGKCQLCYIRKSVPVCALDAALMKRAKQIVRDLGRGTPRGSHVCAVRALPDCVHSLEECERSIASGLAWRMPPELNNTIETFVTDVLCLEMKVEHRECVCIMGAREVRADASDAHFDGVYAALHLMTVLLEGDNSLKFHVDAFEVVLDLKVGDVYYANSVVAHRYPHSNCSSWQGTTRRALVIGFGFRNERCPSGPAFAAAKGRFYHWKHVMLPDGRNGLQATERPS